MFIEEGKIHLVRRVERIPGSQANIDWGNLYNVFPEETDGCAHVSAIINKQIILHIQNHMSIATEINIRWVLLHKMSQGL